MSFSQWLFGGIENPFEGNQWGPLHIATLVCCGLFVVGFYFLVKHARDKEKTKNIILCSLAGAIAFFEVMIRFVYCVKLYVLHQAEMNGVTALWIVLPKPWCAISCWALIACIFIKKRFFRNYASLSALFCAVVFFVYPGVGYNNVYLLFENWYSILTHALLLTSSVTMIVLKITDFRYREFWKLAVCFILTFLYGLLEIFVLKLEPDPMYFMPGGDIQADILRLPYGLYLFCYIAIFLVFINVPYLAQKQTANRSAAAKF